MSAPGEAKTRSRVRERGVAQDRRSRPRARATADTGAFRYTMPFKEGAGDARFCGGRLDTFGKAPGFNEAEG